MKKILILLILLSIGKFNFINQASAYVNVNGHFRNGEYISPHVRSNPNGLKFDNYSWKSSQGLYNKTYGKRGSAWDTPTWITDKNYYEGKSIYENLNNKYILPNYNLNIKS